VDFGFPDQESQNLMQAPDGSEVFRTCGSFLLDPFFGLCTPGSPTRRTTHVGLVGDGLVQSQINAIIQGVLAEPDQFEPNDTLARATVLGSMPEITLRDLTIHNASDVDFFKVTANQTGKLTINVLFDSGLGNLGLQVRDRNNNRLVADTVDGSGLPFSVQRTVIPGPTGQRLDVETVTIPVVSQEEYFIEVFTTNFGNAYTLEIENFPAPVPTSVTLHPNDDSGPSNLDNVTNVAAPRILVLADLTDLANIGIPILTASQAMAGQTPGAAVQVFVDGVARGFANPAAGSNNTLFTFTFSPGQLSQGLTFVTAAVRIFDGQQNGRSQLSRPLLLTLDTLTPVVSAPDLLASSDSGFSNTDNVTNIWGPAFQGTGEPNARVRLRANGVVVGQGVIGTDGSWEVTVEPLADGTYTFTAVAEDLAGNVSAVSPPLQVTIDSRPPNSPFLDLIENSDTGRNNRDNITRGNLNAMGVPNNQLTLTLTVGGGDPVPGNAPPEDLQWRLFDLFEGERLIASQGLSAPDFFTRTVTLSLGDGVGPGLFANDGVHALKLVSEDRAGNLSPEFILQVTFDTVAPGAPTLALDPSNGGDTGVAGQPATLIDRITRATAKGFVGTAEANAIVRLFANSVPDGLTVAVPLDGNQAFPNGQWRQAGTLGLNDPRFFPLDGLRTITATAEDLAGNVSQRGTLEVFIDTQGPQVTGLLITNRPNFDLFDPKPSSNGPTPRVDSLTISLRDLPNRVAQFLYGALNVGVAGQPGHYLLRGDHNGVIPITQVVVTNLPPVPGQAARATVELRFASPLPDDRYTLTVADTLVDDAGNRLDGENNAVQPLETPLFPTGDGKPGGSFVARFTVDSRPEIATVCCGSVYVDINGNFVFDPEGRNNDQVNRDLVFLFGSTTDAVFAGNFAPQGAASSSGFDKLGAYGRAGSVFRWLLDFNHDGVPDFSVVSGLQIDGLPVAGDFAPGHPGDEIGLFDGVRWFLDSNGNNNLDAGDTVLAGNLRGFPITGDFDGDGRVDLATWQSDRFLFDLAFNGLSGNADAVINFGFPGVLERPVAGDLNLDGVDDIGLFVPGRDGVTPREAAEWYFLVSTGTPVPGTVSTLNHAFRPAPFGTDLFAQFGDELAVPILGNFDPPNRPQAVATSLITQAYQHFLQRDADAAGMSYWADQLGNGLSKDGFLSQLLGSSEYFALHGSTNTAFVAGLYQDVLDRGPADEEAAGWLAALLAGVSRQQVALTFLTSAEARARQANGIAWTTAAYTDVETWIGSLYEKVLQRSASAGDQLTVSRWVAQGMSHQQVVDGFVHSVERRSQVITEYYQQYLGRNPDQVGLNYWLGVLAQGGRREDVLVGVLGSQEYYLRQGGTDSAFVRGLYQDILGRTADAVGVANWTDALRSASRGDVARGFVASAEYRAKLLTGWYQDYLGRAVDADGLRYWLEQMRNGLAPEKVQSTLLASREYQRLLRSRSRGL
jgi:hypothetical protein